MTELFPYNYPMTTQLIRKKCEYELDLYKEKIELHLFIGIFNHCIARGVPPPNIVKQSIKEFSKKIITLERNIKLIENCLQQNFISQLHYLYLFS